MYIFPFIGRACSLLEGQLQLACTTAISCMHPSGIVDHLRPCVVDWHGIVECWEHPPCVKVVTGRRTGVFPQDEKPEDSDL